MDKASEDGWRRILGLCAKMDSVKRVEEFFELFLTIEEKEALALRLLLVEALLKEKRTQREIAADLKISISKITRGSNALKTTSEELKEYLKAQLG